MFRMFWQILAVYLAAVNLAAFAAFGIDKWKAMRQRLRLPAAPRLGRARAGGARRAAARARPGGSWTAGTSAAAANRWKAA